MPKPLITRLLLLVGVGLTSTTIASSRPADVDEEPACLADLDGDLQVGSKDLGRLLATWGECGTRHRPGDLDGDGHIDGRDVGIMFGHWGPLPESCIDGPTPAEPFHMPTMIDASTLDPVILEDWHVDTIDGRTRQKLIDIHVDHWWDDVEIRVPVRLIIPLEGPVHGFVINGSGLTDDSPGDKSVSGAERMALDGGVGVVKTKIKSLKYYADLPSSNHLRARFMASLDWRYTEYYLWGSIMMRAITAALDDELFHPGPVIAYGNSKNGMTPMIAAIHDDRITAVRSTRASTTFSPIRAHDPIAVAEVASANEDFAMARAAGLPQGDQNWNYYNKGFKNLVEMAGAFGWTETEVLSSIERVADDLYVSENRSELAARGVEIFSLPGSHDWVAYDVPSSGEILPNLRTYIVPNGGHGRIGHPSAPSDDVDAGFFAEQLFHADRGLETPGVTTVIKGDVLEVTVTFPDGGDPEDSRIFWMYDRGPDGSSWYLYRLFPKENWTTMTGKGNTRTASISLEPGRGSIDLLTTHTVTVGQYTIPISAPYTRVWIDGPTLSTHQTERSARRDPIR